MAVTVSQRSVITQDVPSRLLAITLPPGVTLEKFVEAETERLRGLYPKPKTGSIELGPEVAEMLQIAKYNRAFWEERYQLTKLEIREQLGWAKKATNGGIAFADRRQFPVTGYEVESFEQDAIFPL